MGAWTYYSPLWIGVLLVLAVNDVVRSKLPVSMPVWGQWTVVAAAAVCFAIECQLLMIAAQGIFAQVLPVPRGRSVRGRPAVAGGWGLLGFTALALVAVFLFNEGLRIAAGVLGVMSLAALTVTVLTYIWNWPVAVEDFGSERRRRSAPT